jgi:thioredoxin
VSVVHIDHSSLDTTVADSPNLIVDIWASWCGPCRAFAPTFEAVADNNPDVTFAKLQLDASEENELLGHQLGIQAVPTLLLFKGGQLHHAIPGALRRPDLERLVQALREAEPAAQD